MNLYEKLLELSPLKFEELCFELVYESGFYKISWRKGGADSGRDIQAQLITKNGIVGELSEKWFFECKRYAKGVPPADLMSKIAWADADKPDHLVFFISSYLSVACKQWVEKIALDKSYKIHILDGKNIEKLLSKHLNLTRRYFSNDYQIELMESSKKNWVQSNIFTDSAVIASILTSDFPITKWSIEDLSFILCSYYLNFEYIQMSKDYMLDYDESNIYAFEKELSKRKPFKGNVLKLSCEHNTISDSGVRYHEDDSTHEFHVFLYQDISIKNDFLSIYLLKKLENGEYLEINIEQNTAFNAKHKVINNLNKNHYKEIIKSFVSNRHKIYEKVIGLNNL